MKNFHSLTLLFLPSFFFLLSSSNSMSLHPSFPPFHNLQNQSQKLCHEDQRSVLLQLQLDLYYARLQNHRITFSSKADIWDVNNTDCCFWNGVSCDVNGNVIGLDLSKEGLSGSFHPVFDLHHLQHLNLAGNYFNTALFKYEFDKLPNLTHLNLSESHINGQIPIKISYLTRLVSLDLSQDSYHKLKLEKPNLKAFIQNMTSLTELYLDRVNISSDSSKWCETISKALPNLRVLSMSYCGLTGPLCPSLSKLHFLSHLSLDRNPISYLPLNFLKFPSSLVSLSLNGCNLSGHFPGEVFSLPKLQFIDISLNRALEGQLPEFSLNSSLQSLSILGTNFSGKLPVSIGNLKLLTKLDLNYNHFDGPIPESIVQLQRLKYLYIGYNGFGSVKLDMFFQLKNLSGLDLSNISLSMGRHNKSLTFPQFEELYLVSCNLSEFPEFLKSQERLEYLNLSNNNISGTIPNWVWKTSLWELDLSNNHLSSLDQSSSNHSQASSRVTLPSPLCNITQLSWFNASYNNLSGSIPNCFGKISGLEVLDLQRNSFTGILPNFAEATHLQILQVGENGLEAKLPRSLASCTKLYVLDVRNNKMHDTFPFWLEKLPSLKVLVLKGNRFYGKIKFRHKNAFPALDVLDMASNEFFGVVSIDFHQATQLRSFKISDNKLEGKLPRSLANFTKLEVLDVGHNMIHDTFPFWLEKLPNLKVLILRGNRFFGPIKTTNVFPMLRILGIGSNNFSGELSTEFLQCLRAMMLMPDGSERKQDYIGDDYYQDSVTIVNKGIELLYEKILILLTCLNLSNNSFHGRIPEEIQNLKSLMVLNLSQNSFSGRIPSTLENLKELESLDLSKNKLSGKIPPQLTSLTFLEALNLSYNQLEGSIPQSNQFLTFSNDSYRGNPKLCGPPLTRKCNEVGEPEPPPKEHVDSWLDALSVWKIALIGYGSGIVVGLCVGYMVLNELGHKWCDRLIRRDGKRKRR